MIVQQNQLPKWLPSMNAMTKGLSKVGVAFGPIFILSVPGRRSGQPQTTPVSTLTVNGQRYVIGGQDRADWVKNVRAAGGGVLARGRDQQRVRLVEVPVDEREPVLRAYPAEVPGGVMFFKRLYGISGDADSFATLTETCPVFRIESEATIDA